MWTRLGLILPTATKRCWQGPGTPGVITPLNRGQRLIVVHAGSTDGFVPGTQLIYKASSSTGDYHREMNGENFRKWIEQRLLPNLDCPCDIVMDNASYHSVQKDRCPTSSTRKADIKVMLFGVRKLITCLSRSEMQSTDCLLLIFLPFVQSWLHWHDIPFSDDMLCPQFLELARINRPPPTYAIDQLIQENCHEILRLPPYHPEFNALEIIWSQLKSTISQRNITFRYKTFSSDVSQKCLYIYNVHAIPHIDFKLLFLMFQTRWCTENHSQCLSRDWGRQVAACMWACEQGGAEIQEQWPLHGRYNRLHYHRLGR